MDASLRYDHYKVLGIRRDADPDEIKRAYRERVKQCHPDLHPTAGANIIFHAVHEAYVVLSDHDRRRTYDDRLRFYRPSDQGPVISRSMFDRGSPGAASRRSPVREEADRPVHRFAYVGLHVTGLLFGFSLIFSLLMGISVDYMPAWTLVFALPGILAIPASLAGLRA